MPGTVVKVGPADHGRRMSLDEFDHAEGQEGYVYELSRGVVTVVGVPNPGHLAQVNAVRWQLAAYAQGHPGRIHSLAGSGECDGNVARGGDAGRRLCSIARRREQGCSFQSVAGTCVSFGISKELLDTVVLGKQTLDEEVIGQTARTRAEPLPPARDLAQSVVAALDRARLRYIAAAVVLKTGFKRAAVI